MCKVASVTVALHLAGSIALHVLWAVLVKCEASASLSPKCKGFLTLELDVAVNFNDTSGKIVSQNSVIGKASGRVVLKGAHYCCSLCLAAL